MTDRELSAVVAELRTQVRDLREQTRRHDEEDDRRFAEHDKEITSLRLSNAKWIGVVATVVGLLSLVSACASVWSAVNRPAVVRDRVEALK